MKKFSRAVEKAKYFLLSGRDSFGLWNDFKSQTHGESIDWVSSYIGLSLLQSGISISELELTAQSISERQNRGYGGWGYNQKIVPDADSTAFAILFLSNFRYNLDQAKDFLLKHQKSNGSFGTFLPELIRQYYRIPPEMSVEGWCSGIPDITAIALQVLKDGDNIFKYLKKAQDEKGFWRTYWYNNNIYSTVHVIKAIKKYDSGLEVKKAQDWLVRQKIIPEVPFYIALSLQGLLINGSFTEEIQKRINKLLNLQQEDGSWRTYPILRFPMPSNLEPWKDASRWREETKDQNRFFTTATCLQTLVEYKKVN